MIVSGGWWEQRGQGCWLRKDDLGVRVVTPALLRLPRKPGSGRPATNDKRSLCPIRTYSPTIQHRTKRRLNRDDSGFTLVEVLTISLIIGILSSIAVPLLHSQTSKAQGATIASDLRNPATSMESYLTDVGSYGTGSALTAAGYAPSVSAGTTIVIVEHTTSAYCLAGLRNTGVPGTVAGLRSTALRWYDSAAGGLQPVGATGCPTTNTVAGGWQTRLHAQLSIGRPPARTEQRCLRAIRLR
ncbi:MAG: type IV pilin protein [Actinomycetes bacterium]